MSLNPHQTSIGTPTDSFTIGSDLYGYKVASGTATFGSKTWDTADILTGLDLDGLAFKGEPELTLSWLEKERQNWQVVLKGRSNWEAYFWHARILVIADLEEEAILNLRHFIESPSWVNAALVEFMPEFDALKNYPAYIDLLREYKDH